MHYIGQDASFTDAYKAIKAKTLVEAVEILIKKLHLCQCALGNAYKGQEHLVAAVTRACQDSPEMSDALSDPATNFETLVSRLRARAAVVQGKKSAKSSWAAQTRIIDKPHVKNIDARDMMIVIPANKIIESVGSATDLITAHSNTLMRSAAERESNGRRSASDHTYRAFIIDFEKGCIIESDSKEDNIEEEDDIEDNATAYFMINKLQDCSFIHWISGYHDDIDQEGFHHKLEVRELDQSERKDGLLEPASQFVLEHHEGEIFQGILPDTGAAKVSTIGRRQLAALQRSYPEITVNRTHAGEHSIRFGQGRRTGPNYQKARPPITTSFQAARFLKSLSIKDTWEALQVVWIDTYLGPPDVISHDIGTNFAALEFKTEAKMMGIQYYQVPVEAHNAIGKVKRYYAPLRRAYNIISAELGASVNKDVILQMAVKAINDTVGPDRIVLTVLVFDTYLCITTDSPLSALTARRAEAMRKVMAKLRCMVAERQVNDTLNTRNGPIIMETLNLAPGSKVKVWRKGDSWSEPYKVISVNGHDVTVDLGNGAVAFRATSVQQYLHDSKDESDRLIRLPLSPPQEDLNRQDSRSQVNFDQTPRTRVRVRLQDHPANPNHRIETRGVHAPQTPEMPALPRRRGRPRGSKNKPKAYAKVFISKKERDDLELAVKLQREGKIATNGALFELLGKTEIDSLIANGTFKILHRADIDLRGIRIFNSRLVNEIKGKNEIPYKKS
ncbi:conserved hypothetical protein [Talaromyces stipitatus ATCC 10500]|uniref:Integrase catalytic domain-containing protein n=1 Tax=Talaromyces stipitatus (strain ATCC 10500 / CBS 375.48 / QM 6759 / NRRL 1006) TaxID=441959 RepID=B8MN80_TALSN|nr:uncharacterized protein TSTA_107360 [Talaromyces stipitatus ATCC 10500]EED14529.1 conserved hypothetical protein [Talaromyces stipitatus ATCC 10500]